MKKLIIIIVLILGLASILNSQKVDSIKIEQAGDFIKIRYKILNSSAGQVYRVKIQFTVNGGLRQEPRNITGDVGEQVAGGKTDYWALWDVLKDIDELKSVEFYVSAELLNKSPGIQDNSSSAQKKANPTGWDKKRFHVMVDFQYPGPKFGVMLGYTGAVGIMLKYVRGKTIMAKDVTSKAPTSYTGPVEAYYSSDLTARIVNSKGFQMHVAAGLAMSQFSFYDNSSATTVSNNITLSNLKGAEVGFLFDIKRVSIIATISHFDPKSVEERGHLRCWSNRTFYDLGVGVRF